jgi:hypothetical protein
VEELKRQLRRDVLGDLRPILEASGIQFPDIGGVMSDEEHRSSLASIAGGGRPQGELHVSASGLVEGHKQPLPSVKPDAIDNLTQPISCSLILLVGGSFQMEVGRGLVYPRQTMFDDIQMDTSSYAVVNVDMVHDNSKGLKLKVLLDDTTLTIWDAVTRRVQWRRTFIDVDPSAAASASTTPSQPNTSPALIVPEARLSPSSNLELSPFRE